MFIDARQLPESHTVRSDVCIIGAGAAGITIATQLAGSKLDVCVLESGGYEVEAADQALYQGSVTGLPYTPLHAARVRYFGGTTNHWSGWCRPLDPIDFERRPWVAHSGWPFGFDVLRPYYQRAEPLFGLRPVGFDTSTWANSSDPELAFLSHDVETTTFRRSAPARFGQLYRADLAAAKNVSVFLHANAVQLVPDTNVRSIESIEAMCLTGTRFSLRARAFVLATGGIENARILLTSNKVSEAGLGNTNDLVGRYFMDHPGVTSGMIVFSNPVQPLGLYSGVVRQVNLAERIDGGNMEKFISPQDKLVVLDWIRGGAQREEYQDKVAPILDRQCVVCHNPEGIAFQRRLGSYDEVMNVVQPGDIGKKPSNDSSVGEQREAMGALRLSRHMLARQELLNYCAVLEESRGWSEVIGDDGLWSAIGNVAANFGDLSTAFYRKYFDKESRRQLVRIVNILEPSPNPNSRVTLNSERDALGMNRVDLAWRLNESDKSTIESAHSVLAAELGRAGLGRLLKDFEADSAGWPDDLSHGWHHMGTTRMHSDPARGVVDENCRVHGIVNLYVAGSSVFPTYGFSQPTFTIVALALRLADRLMAEAA